MMNEFMQNQSKEEISKKARYMRCFFSLAMGILCFIALLFPLFMYTEVVKHTYGSNEEIFRIDNGFTMMGLGSMYFGGSFFDVIFFVLCWMQFIFSIAAIVISIVALFSFSNKAMNIITLILPIVAMVSIFTYMIQGGSISLIGYETITLSFIPFILGIAVFVVGVYLRSKYKMPIEASRYEQAMRFGIEPENINNNDNFTDSANTSSSEACVNNNNDKLLSEAQIQGYLMSVKSNIPNESLFLLKQQLYKVPQSRMSQLAYLPTKSPTTILLMSIFLGGFGVDRFMLGDIGLGVCKLLFSGFTLLIWPFVDIFMCYKKAKEKNFETIMMCITGCRI